MLAGIALAGCAQIDLDAPPVDRSRDATHTRTGGIDCAAGVWAGDYLIDDQVARDALAGYTAVAGTLRIASPSLTSLDGLSCLTSVRGSLDIDDNQALADLDGLAGVTRIGGDLTIEDNDRLTTVDSFAALVSVGGSVRFFDNQQLSAIRGFGALETIGGDIELSSYRQGLTMDGFGALASMGGRLDLAGDITVSGFDTLASVAGVRTGGGTVIVHGFDALHTIRGRMAGGEADTIEILGMNNVRSIGDISFVDVSRVVLDGLTSLRAVHGNMGFFETGDVVLEGLVSLETVEGNMRFSETGRVFAAGLTALTSIHGSLSFQDADMTVADVEGFRRLAAIGGDLRIEDSETSLTHARFRRLAHIGGALSVVDNHGLARLDLRKLRSVGGDLVLHRNDAIADLHGLRKLRSVGGDLEITANTSLPACAAEALRDRLMTEGFEGQAIVEDNGTGTCTGRHLHRHPWSQRLASGIPAQAYEHFSQFLNIRADMM